MYKTMEQIQKDYDGQWVYMINCKHNDRGSVIGGIVALHSDSMNKVLRGMAAYDKDADSVYVRYIGDLPEGVAILL